MPAPYTFRVYMGNSAAELMALLRNEMQRKGASVNGSDSAGNFSMRTPIGLVAGRYRLDGKSVEVTILKKPSAVSFAQIQDKMTDQALDARAMLKSRKPPTKD